MGSHILVDKKDVSELPHISFLIIPECQIFWALLFIFLNFLNLHITNVLPLLMNWYISITCIYLNSILIEVFHGVSIFILKEGMLIYLTPANTHLRIDS